MENLNEITAVWANKTATTKLGEIAQKQLNGILLLIKEAANKNEFNIIANSLESITKTELSSRGFKVEYQRGDPRDQREGSYYTISW